MNTHFLVHCCLAIFLVVSIPPGLNGDQSEDEAAIRKSAAAYVDAFNRKDAKAIAAQWAPDAVYTNSMTGEQVVGRKAIGEQLVAMFEESKDTRLEVVVNSVNFVSPHVAVEEGTVRVLVPNAEPDETVYSAVHIKIEGKWFIDRISEESVQIIRSNYSRLKDLEWMIGTWVDQDDESKVETTCRWTKNQNFITRSFKISVNGESDLSGMQLIGWDPSTQNIRSWVFDSDGGFGKATWTKKENRWMINASATLPDGRRSSAVKIITVVDDDTITWQSTGRALDGEILPNIDPIKLTRNSDSE